MSMTAKSEQIRRMDRERLTLRVQRFIRNGFRRWAQRCVAVAVLTLLTSCTNVSEYSTVPGECYVGKIIEAEFVRSENTLEPDVELELTLDAYALSKGEVGGTLTTDDGKFLSATISQMRQLPHDSLSRLQFPGGRVRNYFAHALPVDGDPATVIISLMENDEVEVRIIRPDLIDDGEDTSLFGIFRLSRKAACAE